MPLVEAFLDPAVQGSAHRLVEHGRRRRADELVRIDAETLAVLVVDEHVPARRVERPLHGGGVAHEGLEPARHGLQPALGLAQAGDVDDRDDHALHLVVGDAVGRHPDEEPLVVGAHLPFDRGAAVDDLPCVVVQRREIEGEHDVADGTPDVLGSELDVVRQRRGVAPDVELGVEEQRADLGALEQVVHVGRQLAELGDLRLVLGVDGVELLVDRLQLLVGRLQLLVRRDELLVGGLQFLDRRLQALPGDLQLPFEHGDVELRLLVGLGRLARTEPSRSHARELGQLRSVRRLEGDDDDQGRRAGPRRVV